jgi:galactonate dehydratase
MHQNIARRRARLLPILASQFANSSKPSTLDIADIRHFPVREPASKKAWSILRVSTRSGLAGWGECRFRGEADLAALRSAWIGRPATAYATIKPSDPFRAALDMAALDILGKAANAPVYRILGGPTRTKVRAYSFPDTQAFPVSVVEVPAPVWRNQGEAYQNELLKLVDDIPADRDFIVLANGSLSPGDAASVARTLEGKHPLWFDEPCSHSNLDTIRKVAGKTVIPLGFGAGIDDPGVFQAFLRDGLIDVVRPDMAVFGITGARQIAALAEPYYVAVAPRHSGGPIGTAAAIHLAASIPNFFIQHVPRPTASEDRAMRRAIVSPELESGQDGFLTVTNAPGLGITVDEAALEKHHAS